MSLDITGLGSIASFAETIVNKIFPNKMSDAEKAQAQLALQTMLEARDAALLDAQKGIIVSEMQQGDNYTKRARPTVVYAGLGFIFFVHVFIPIISWAYAFKTGKALEGMPTLSLPEDFWWVWGSVCSIWMIGRTFERRGVSGKLGVVTDLITGK